MRGGWLPDATSLSVPLTGAALLAMMLLGAGAGVALHRWQAKKGARREKESDESIAQEGYLIAAVLGTLGLLLAFCFGMVLNRYETRRELVVQEANAIGTAYLRTQLLDEPYRTRLSRLLVDYAANRIDVASADQGTNDRYLEKNDRLLTAIWAQVKASRESALSHGLTTALLQTFNEVIDLDAERKVAWELRLPPEILALLVSYIVVTSVVIGYQIDGPRGRRAALVLFALLALSITFITDINRPMSGQSRESQRPMQMLLQSLRSQPPAAFDAPSAAKPEDGP
jgi:hypothetical protein